MERIRASLFFIPVVGVLLSIVVAAVTIWIDSRLDLQGDDLPLGVTSTVTSARAVLTTVAGATMTVRGDRVLDLAAHHPAGVKSVLAPSGAHPVPRSVQQASHGSCHGDLHVLPGRAAIRAILDRGRRGCRHPEPLGRHGGRARHRHDHLDRRVPGPQRPLHGRQPDPRPGRERDDRSCPSRMERRRVRHTDLSNRSPHRIILRTSSGSTAADGSSRSTPLRFWMVSPTRPRCGCRPLPADTRSPGHRCAPSRGCPITSTRPSAGIFDAVSTGNTRTMQQDISFGLRQMADVGLKALSTGDQRSHHGAGLDLPQRSGAHRAAPT